MHRINAPVGAAVVALRKESVDRNEEDDPDNLWSECRSPQGERG